MSVREALRQIDIQMNDATNLYDGLETLWLGSSDESLSNQQVYIYIIIYLLNSNKSFECIIIEYQ